MMLYLVLLKPGVTEVVSEPRLIVGSLARMRGRLGDLFLEQTFKKCVKLF